MRISSLSGYVMERKENRSHPFKARLDGNEIPAYGQHVADFIGGRVYQLPAGWTNPRDYSHPIIRGRHSRVLEYFISRCVTLESERWTFDATARRPLFDRDAVTRSQTSIGGMYIRIYQQYTRNIHTHIRAFIQFIQHFAATR